MRKNRDYVPDPVKIKHVLETLELLILGFIEACRDEGLSDDATQEKIMRRFPLTPDVAKEYLALETV